MTAMPENRRSQRLDWTNRIQLYGLLLKKPMSPGGQTSNRWSRRFFIIKDGYMIYYSDSEKKEFEKRQFLNMHPKGIIPLGNCQITPAREPTQPFAIHVDSDEFLGRFTIAADNEHERDKWISAMQRSQGVTWTNVEISNTMINQLETQGLNLAKERQEYFNQLQAEAIALSDEKEKTEELEKINQELEKEKSKMENWMQEIKEEYERIKEELDTASQCLKDVEDDKHALTETLNQQTQNLKNLNEDKEKILKKLKDRENMTEKLSQENQNLSQTTEELQSSLRVIEEKVSKTNKLKSEAAEQLHYSEERAQELEEEKKVISEHAQDLKSTIKDLVEQKELTESELREEVKARIAAEKKLKNAENSLVRIDHAVQDKKSDIKEDVKEEISVNVKQLKRFFEDLAAEQKFDSDKPVIVKNMIHTRKTLAKRAKTLKFERRKRSSIFPLVNTWTGNQDLSVMREKKTVPKRRAATTVIKPGSLNKIMSSAGEAEFV